MYLYKLHNMYANAQRGYLRAWIIGSCETSEVSAGPLQG